MKRLAAVWLFLLALAAPAAAQSSPGLIFGQVPTAAQWNSYFSAKQDVLGYTPVNKAGDTMLGGLVTIASATGGAGLNLPPGTAPTSPNNGDLWTTSSGVFAQIAGSTVQLSTGGASIAPGAANELALYTGTSAIGPLSTANNGVLVTSGSGVPSIATTLPSGLTIPGPTLSGTVAGGVTLSGNNTYSGTALFTGAAASLTANGQAALGASSTAGAILKGEGSSFDLTLENKTGGAVCNIPTGGTTFGCVSLALTNPLAISSGGTGAATQSAAAAAIFPTPTRAGDIAYWNGTSWTTLAGNNSGTLFLQETSAGVPSWVTVAGAGTVTSATIAAGTGIGVSGTCTITTTGTCTVALSNPVAASLGGTGVASPTAHTIPINEGGSAQNNTGTGTLGQAIVSQGGSADPAYKSGVWTLINTTTASNQAALADTTSLTSSYNDYLIVFENVLPVTNAVTCNLQLQSGGTFQTTNNQSILYVPNAGGSGGAINGSILFCSNTSDVQNTGSGFTGEVRISLPSSTTFPKEYRLSGSYSNAANVTLALGTGRWTGGNGAITGVQMLFSSGNVASGTMKVYGRL